MTFAPPQGPPTLYPFHNNTAPHIDWIAWGPHEVPQFRWPLGDGWWTQL